MERKKKKQTSPRIISAIERRNGINDHHRKAHARHHLCGFRKEFRLMIGVVCACVDDVFEDELGIEIIPVVRREGRGEREGERKVGGR